MTPENKRQPSPLSLEEVARIAREVTLRDGAHAPMVIVDGGLRSAACQIDELGGTHEERMLQMRVAGYTLGKSVDVGDLEQIFFICEGWMSAAIKGKLPAVSPFQDPNRVEVLLINQWLLKSGQTRIAGYEMIRTSENKLVGLRKLPDFDDQAGTAENYLLTAFVNEFRAGRQERSN